LLFYSDGTTIWNKNHQAMKFGTGLLGHSSSTQSAMVIPRPQNDSEYYIFTVGSGSAGGEPGFNYYTIDMNGDGGLGEVTNGPIDLTEGRANSWSEKVAAIKGDDCNTYWVISYVQNEFFSYKVTSSGVAASPVKTVIQYNAPDRRGYLKISPDGKKIAIAHVAGSLLLYDFDDATGIISGQKFVTIQGLADKPYGVEFSANSEKLYVHASNDFYSDVPEENTNPDNHFSELLQFDLSSSDIATINASKIVIDSQNLFRGALQLGPDQKIYRALSETYSKGTRYLGVIENPENDGLACNYKHNAIDLGVNNSTQGLPPFIASIFSQIEITNTDTTGSINILNDKIINLCDGDTFNINPEPLTGIATYTWFKDGAATPFSTMSNISLTNISAANDGLYSLVVIHTDECGGVNTLEGEFSLKVHDSPKANQPSNIIQCDDDNDGFYSFNLNSLKDIEILNGQSNIIFEVQYFTSQIEADLNSNPITNLYINSSAFSTDTIIARIHNKNNINCFDTKSFTIQIFDTSTPPNISSLGKCDSTIRGTDDDGLEYFDLTQKDSELLNGLSISDFTINYFLDAALNNLITNPTTFSNSNAIQTVYYKVENKLNPTCFISSSFSIEVFKLPTINNLVSLKQCDDDNDGFSSFNLTEVNSKISTNYLSETFTYYLTQASAINKISTDEILNPTNYTNSLINTENIWSRVESSMGCFRVSEINLVVSTTQIPLTYQKQFYECDDNLDTVNNEYDGISLFDFSSATTEIEGNFPPGQKLIISYYRNETDALSELNPILNTSNYRNIGYPNSQIIYVRVDSELDNDCLGLGPHITLNVEKVPIANAITIDRQCDDDFDGFYNFDTSLVESTLLNGQIGMKIEYYDELGNSLPSPLPNPFFINSQTITIKLINTNSIDPDGSCFDETTLEFIVDKKPIANVISPIINCDDDLDGMFPFDTSTIENLVLNGQTGMSISYLDENNNVLSTPLPNPFLSHSQTITIKVENELNSNCTAETTLDFIVNERPNFELDESAIICLNLPPIVISTFNPNDNYSYEWRDENDAIISNAQEAIISIPGNYTVIATSAEGCLSFPKTISIEPSIIANLTENDISIVDDSDNNSITISTLNLGIGDYEFAIQKEKELIGFYQDENYFDSLAPGIYTVFVRDKNNCGIAQIDVSIIGFPKFFTPNNDGKNDTWRIIGVNENFYTTSDIFIFDRFGKLIKKIDPKGEGWNGLLNGNYLPSTDYWFTIELKDKNGNTRIRKGHFSLIRR